MTHQILDIAAVVYLLSASVILIFCAVYLLKTIFPKIHEQEVEVKSNTQNSPDEKVRPMDTHCMDCIAGVDMKNGKEYSYCWCGRGKEVDL